MTMVSTFYLSRILGKKVQTQSGETIGRLRDMIVDVTSIRPRVVAIMVRHRRQTRLLDYSGVYILKDKGQYQIKCTGEKEYPQAQENVLYLAKNILDKQLVDMDGRKLVRVNDLRIAAISSGTFLIAVDVGTEGLLRRLGIARPVKALLKPFGKNIPSKLMLWDEVETVDFGHSGIKMSKPYSKLSTLHPSDLADIIEDLDIKTQAEVFASLEEEKAADVLEELETDAQRNVLESIPVEKAADLLELMPADEVADILDELADDKAEELLGEMEQETSEEVRELMEYEDYEVGSFMTTDYISFHENLTVEETINELRKLKPASDTIYYLYVLDEREKLVATVSLRDIIVSQPGVKLQDIMNTQIIYVYDTDDMSSLTELISKYNLLAVPVVDKDMAMMGMVIIDDVVHALLKARKRRA